ncbi:MAG: BMP family ABC transporter substrate-binding protein [Oscillospiraceae bacterium]|nr:BMP family ABC transporter substrate-binding protein [Oscillospiraceae bacterium]
MLVALLAGCAEESDTLKVGMVTDSGTIDDKSFNQGTWEGILKAKADFGIEERYLMPGGEAHSDYVQEITNLYDSGFKVIVTPGFKFETAIYEMQERYTDAVFVLLDGEPNDGNWAAGFPDYKTGANTINFLFAEDQAGFLVGVAAAVELGSGELGFIGGMEVPAVQRFNWGFQQGIKYANDNYGTSCNISADNCIYQGTFTDVAAGQQLAAVMYDRGVRAVFAAAGGVGVGVINEGKERRASGQDVWVIGVDVDQYDDGLYSGSNSCILTSAMKGIDVATYDTVKAILDDNFTGGRTVLYEAANDGIGIPKNNPNLGARTIGTVDEVFNGIKNGSIRVQNTGDGLLP